MEIRYFNNSTKKKIEKILNGKASPTKKHSKNLENVNSSFDAMEGSSNLYELNKFAFLNLEPLSNLNKGKGNLISLYSVRGTEKFRFLFEILDEDFNLNKDFVPEFLTDDEKMKDITIIGIVGLVDYHSPSGKKELEAFKKELKKDFRDYISN